MGDIEEAPVDQVLVGIPVGKVSKLGDSGLDGKGKMFESEEDDDPEVQEQIKAVLADTGPLGDLQLSESEEGSESDSPGDDDDGGDPNKTKQYYQGQEDETAKDPGLKSDSSAPIVVTDPPAVPGNPRKTGWFQSQHSGQRHPANQAHTFQGQGPQQWKFQQSPCLQVRRFSRIKLADHSL